MKIAFEFFYFDSRRRCSHASAGRDQLSTESPEPPDPPQRRRSFNKANVFNGSQRGSGQHGTASSKNIKTAAGLSLGPRRIHETDGLPGTVQQARERLVQRLRGAALTNTRERWNSEVTLPVINFPANASSRDAPEFLVPFAQAKATGSSNALDLITRLMKDVFQGGYDHETAECPICLERFWDGDGLFQLNCGHSFHSSCLERWMEGHLDCPYCRASIVPATDWRKVGS